MLPVAELEVRITDPPVQKVVALPAEIVGVEGNGLTVTMNGAEVDTHPVAPTETVYDPEVVTESVFKVEAFDQVLPVALLEVNTTLPPAQKVVGPPAVIVGVAGNEFTVITVGKDAFEQLPLVTVTV